MATIFHELANFRLSCRRGHPLSLRSLMLTAALKATNHVAAWLVWQSMRVSLLEDLDSPRPPRLPG